jgi:plasmid stabilization system protein ParE
MKTAAADLRAIERYIARDDPQIARAVVERLLVAGESLGSLPRKGRPHPIRHCRIMKEGTLDEEVQILAVMHGRQQQ